MYSAGCSCEVMNMITAELTRKNNLLPQESYFTEDEVEEELAKI